MEQVIALFKCTARCRGALKPARQVEFRCYLKVLSRLRRSCSWGLRNRTFGQRMTAANTEVPA